MKIGKLAAKLGYKNFKQKQTKSKATKKAKCWHDTNTSVSML
jgi:hypothetical protein